MLCVLISSHGSHERLQSVRRLFVRAFAHTVICQSVRPPAVLAHPYAAPCESVLPSVSSHQFVPSRTHPAVCPFVRIRVDVRW